MAPTSGETGARSGRVFAAVFRWAEDDGSGVAFDSSTGFELPGGAVRSPDAAWVIRSRLAELSAEDRQGFLPLCPDFVVELLSPSDSLAVLPAQDGGVPGKRRPPGLVDRSAPAGGGHLPRGRQPGPARRLGPGQRRSGAAGVRARPVRRLETRLLTRVRYRRVSNVRGRGAPRRPLRIHRREARSRVNRPLHDAALRGIVATIGATFASRPPLSRRVSCYIRLNGRWIADRVDGRNLESGSRLLEAQPRLPALLCPHVRPNGSGACRGTRSSGASTSGACRTS